MTGVLDPARTASVMRLSSIRAGVESEPAIVPEESSRVVVVDLFQHDTWQGDSADLPVALNRCGVSKVLVRRFEIAAGRAEKELLLGGGGRSGPLGAQKQRARLRPHSEVGAIQNPILKLDEEGAHAGRRVAPELGNACG